MSRIEDRLRRLEHRTEGGCPECSEGETSGITFGGSRRPDDLRPKAEHCPACGRVLCFTLDLGTAGTIERA